MLIKIITIKYCSYAALHLFPLINVALFFFILTCTQNYVFIIHWLPCLIIVMYNYIGLILGAKNNKHTPSKILKGIY